MLFREFHHITKVTKARESLKYSFHSPPPRNQQKPLRNQIPVVVNLSHLTRLLPKHPKSSSPQAYIICRDLHSLRRVDSPRDNIVDFANKNRFVHVYETPPKGLTQDADRCFLRRRCKYGLQYGGRRHYILIANAHHLTDGVSTAPDLRIGTGLQTFPRIVFNSG